MAPTKHSPPFVGPRQARLLSLWAVTCFAAGLLVFASQRHWLMMNTLALPTALRGSLPSFIHTYVFVVLACLWLARSWRQVWGLGVLIWAVDLALELLQQPSLHAQWHTHPMLRRWLVSTYDVQDVVALSLGLVAAWASLAWVRWVDQNKGGSL